jgi:hypothetical protein
MIIIIIMILPLIYNATANDIVLCRGAKLIQLYTDKCRDSKVQYIMLTISNIQGMRSSRQSTKLQMHASHPLGHKRIYAVPPKSWQVLNVEGIVLSSDRYRNNIDCLTVPLLIYIACSWIIARCILQILIPRMLLLLRLSLL